ncbi:MAG: c-type cytochrome [Deltaproteobacteria bacterium]|nr:c-type cytochrome [Deltaproteobacteria bacterium]
MRLPRLLFIALLLVCAIPVAGISGPDADLARGEALFNTCAACHGDQGQGDALLLAPGIGGLSPWYVEAQIRKFQTGVRGAHPNDIAGLRMRPMSRLLRTDTDTKAVAAYIGTLPEPPTRVTLDGDAARGAPLYAPCIACHGIDGKGNPALQAPSLHSSDWYQLTQLKNFKAGIRGRADDPFGVMMRPMAMMLVDEQAMKDVIAHVQTLGR